MPPKESKEQKGLKALIQQATDEFRTKNKMKSTRVVYLLNKMKNDNTTEYQTLIEQIKAKGYDLELTTSDYKLEKSIVQEEKKTDVATTPEVGRANEAKASATSLQSEPEQSQPENPKRDRTVVIVENETYAQGVLRRAWETGDWKRQALYEIGGMITPEVAAVLGSAAVAGMSSIAPEKFEHNLKMTQFYFGTIFAVSIGRRVLLEINKLPVVNDVTRTLKNKLETYVHRTENTETETQTPTEAKSAVLNPGATNQREETQTTETATIEPRPPAKIPPAKQQTIQSHNAGKTDVPAPAAPAKTNYLNRYPHLGNPFD
jgi:hypothetical protein